MHFMKYSMINYLFSMNGDKNRKIHQQTIDIESWNKWDGINDYLSLHVYIYERFYMQNEIGKRCTR